MSLLSKRPLASAAALMSALLVAGCAGDLQDPERFEDVVACRAGIEVHALFESKCGSSICHGFNEGGSAGGLDLVSPDLPRRLVGVPSEVCGGFLRVDPDHPDDSFLLGKLLEPPAGCGDRMPLVGMLSPAEIACVRAYVRSIAGLGADAGPHPASDAGQHAAPLDASLADASAPDPWTDTATGADGGGP